MNTNNPLERFEWKARDALIDVFRQVGVNSDDNKLGFEALAKIRAAAVELVNSELQELAITQGAYAPKDWNNNLSAKYMMQAIHERLDAIKAQRAALGDSHDHQ